jgi:hypothetical protein
MGCGCRNKKGKISKKSWVEAEEEERKVVLQAPEIEVEKEKIQVDNNTNILLNETLNKPHTPEIRYMTRSVSHPPVQIHKNKTL